jgi:hypothetical protein
MVLYVKRLAFIFSLFLITSMPIYACEKIDGVYESVSEKHWSFKLTINNSEAILLYTDYLSGIKS